MAEQTSRVLLRDAPLSLRGHARDSVERGSEAMERYVT